MTTPRSAASGSVSSRYCGEPGRGLTDDEPVHPQRTGADRGAQPGGAEHAAGRRSARRARRPGPSSSACNSARMSASGSASSQPAVSRASASSALSIIRVSVRSSTRGAGPTWLITSAAAIEPSRAAFGERRARRVAEQEAGGVQVAGAGRVDHPAAPGRPARRSTRRRHDERPLGADRDRRQRALLADAPRSTASKVVGLVQRASARPRCRTAGRPRRRRASRKSSR